MPAEELRCRLPKADMNRAVGALRPLALINLGNCSSTVQLALDTVFFMF